MRETELQTSSLIIVTDYLAEFFFFLSRMTTILPKARPHIAAVELNWNDNVLRSRDLQVLVQSGPRTSQRSAR